MKNIIKIIVAALGLILGVWVVLWILGFVWSIVWYALFFGIIGGVGYGAYKMFRKAENKFLGGGPANGIGSGVDVDMSWDEYERKYLKK